MPEEEKSIPQVLTELWEMLVSYAKQETVEPLKGLARFVAYGMGAALLGSIAIILLTLSGLRALQTQTDDHLTGSLNFVPYLAAFLLFVILILIATSRIKPKGKKR